MRHIKNPLNKVRLIVGILILVFTVKGVNAQTLSTPVDDTKMAWWKDAKFGMFIHWGLYSVPAGTYNGKQYPQIGEWIMNHAKIPVAEYKEYAKQFYPVNYNAEAWVKMAKDAGMKYIVITSKHHDGFALFDSKVTNWDVTDATPYGKDLLKPLVDACRREGLKIGFYYSQAQDWSHPGGAASGGHWDKAQDGSFDEYLDKISIPQVKEILSNYGELDVLWWDTPQSMTKGRADKFLAITKNYPNLITNNRLGGGYPGDTETPEQFVPATGFPGLNWESCMTMNDTWGYKSFDQNWKSAKTLIRQLTDVVSKGGNMLLNVGPTSLGEIPAPSVERLAAIGSWINLNKEAIYGTTPSPFTFLSYGKATRKGQKLFLHVFDYPEKGKLRVPMSNKITRAWLLTDPGKLLKIKAEAGRSMIQLPELADTINTVVALEFIGEPQVKTYPTEGKTVSVSSQKVTDLTGRILVDGNRQTRWEAAKGERKATLEMNLLKPTLISTLLVDEPWHLWEKKAQRLVLQYKKGSEWKTAFEATTDGTGHTAIFKPVKAQFFRLLIENAKQEPTLSEWQLYGPE
ncbi:MAG: alpha-L-fucosidase [Sphingobacteriaceae bacterium]|nr:alpha-L-fucosidase [Sphingobacteriaceae bacterium]